MNINNNISLFYTIIKNDYNIYLIIIYNRKIFNNIQL